jgi:hypothetical protein
VQTVQEASSFLDGSAFVPSGLRAFVVEGLVNFYIPTREGWLYLAVALDLFAWRVVGWAIATRYLPAPPCYGCTVRSLYAVFVL